ncbi:hypothetical protein [Deinococcus ficus]|uniref:hypothetical protein n=1 Tax=Deinococcus ficus TaxID=317577 RepID=UPI0003F98C8B|nr:hypothetical protein [Deinococcus ficus]
MAGETEHSPRPPVLTARSTADELASLSLSADPAVRAAVAVHPNTTPYILGTLAADFPAEVLRNPALPLLRLANPRFMTGWPQAGLIALVRHPDAPAWLRALALTHPRTEYQVAVASHPALTAAERAQLAAHPAWLVRARIAARPDTPPDLLDAFAHDPDYGVRLAAASRPDLPERSVAALLSDPSRLVQQVMRQTLGAPSASRRPG